MSREGTYEMRTTAATSGNGKLISGPLPLYYQVANLMRTSILEGRYPEKSRLPTENDLAERYGVSRPTIRNAKNILETEGFISNIKGSGCYVNGQNAWKTQPPTVENINDILHYGEKMSFKIHEFGMISNTVEIQEKLKNPQESFVLQVKGVRYLQDRPIAVVVYYLPFRFGSRIPFESLDENPFLPQFEKLAGIQVREGIQSISIGRSDPVTSQHLGLQENSPVLVVESVYVDDAQQPIEYVRSQCRDKLPYSIRVKRY